MIGAATGPEYLITFAAGALTGAGAAWVGLNLLRDELADRRARRGHREQDRHLELVAHTGSHAVVRWSDRPRTLEATDHGIRWDYDPTRERTTEPSRMVRMVPPPVRPFDQDADR